MYEPDTITIPRWFDRHLHIRHGSMLPLVLPHTLAQRATGAVIMGNLPDPYQTSTIDRAIRYRYEIQSVLPPDSDFIPCMTLYLTDDISPEEVVHGFTGGAWKAVKLYMANQQGHGGTTGSHHGVRDLHGRYSVFEAMQKHGIPLLGHFEAVEETVDEFDREVVSLERDLIPLLKTFPELIVVFEHITDGRVADFVAESEYSLYATVTTHHLIINRNAMFWNGMNPINYCKPVPKREAHRIRVREHVTSGNPRFGAGTDSAPHDISAKSRCHGCAAGIFTAPHAVELYTTVFDEDNALHHLGPFLSENFLHIYGMNISTETMTIKREVLHIPDILNNIPVFKGGSELSWKLVG